MPVTQMPDQDDQPLQYSRRDLSGGMNNRQQGANLGPNEATVLLNVDIGVAGETRKRPGLSLIEDVSNTSPIALYGFEPAGGTNELLVLEGTNLRGWVGSGSFTTHKSDFTSATKATIFKAGESGENDVVLIGNDTDNWFRMLTAHTFQDLGSTAGTGNDSPPKSSVGTYYRNRVWILKSDLLYYSDAFPADYAVAFDTVSQNYRLPVGEERAVIGIRDSGLIVVGKDQIWALNPSVVPAATDKPEKLLDIGCQAAKTVAQVGDDVYFLAPDGVRGIFRTVQDKLQLGASYPLSFKLKEEFESINWAQISKACAIYWDNKYFLSLPVDASSTNNEVWVYYPAFGSWMVISGWNVSAWTKLKISGEERLFATDALDGKVYRAWTGFDDNGTAINYQEESRKDDMGQPLLKKLNGELKIKAQSSGNYDVSVYASVDDADYVLLGTFSLAGNAPVLPVALPFTLASFNTVTGVFHLDPLGPWNYIRTKIQHNASNGSDEIKILERNIITYAEEYQPEG